MATRNFTTLVSRVNAYTPGCPTPVLISHIREAAIRVCERTLAWRLAQSQFNLTPGIHEYDFIKPSGSDVHVVFAVHMNGFPLDILTLEQAITRHPLWADMFGGLDPDALWSITPSGTINTDEYNQQEFNESYPLVTPPEFIEMASQPQSITQVSPDKFIVLPMPDDVETYTMRMFYALKPSRDAVGMDEVIFNELEDAIFHHALQNLLVMPNSPWADRQAAGYHAKQALHMLTERRARANLGNARGTMIARAPKFA